MRKRYRCLILFCFLISGCSLLFGPVPAPVFNPPGGTYEIWKYREVKISCPDESARIIFRFIKYPGMFSDTNWYLWRKNDSVFIRSGLHIEAYAVRNTGERSETVSAIYLTDVENEDTNLFVVSMDILSNASYTRTNYETIYTADAIKAIQHFSISNFRKLITNGGYLYLTNCISNYLQTNWLETTNRLIHRFPLNWSTVSYRYEDMVGDKQGNIYVRESIWNSEDLDWNDGVVYSTVGSGTACVKYGSKNVYLSSVIISSRAPIAISGIYAENRGNFYMAGYFNSPYDFDPGTGMNVRTNSGGLNFYLSRFNPDCSYAWTQIFCFNTNNALRTVCFDSNGNVYMSGLFKGTVDFDPSSNTVLKTAASAVEDFLIKLDDTGKLLWVKTFAGNSGLKPCSISVNASGEIVVWGSFSGTVDLDPDEGTDLRSSVSNKQYILRLDSSGGILWSLIDSTASQIVLDKAGNLLIVGSFSGSFDCDPTAGVDMRTARGDMDCYLIRVNASGSYEWGKTFGGNGRDIAFRISLDDAESIYVGGYFRTPFGTEADFDPGSGIDSKHTQALYSDVFISVYRSDGQYEWTRTLQDKYCSYEQLVLNAYGFGKLDVMGAYTDYRSESDDWYYHKIFRLGKHE